MTQWIRISEKQYLGFWAPGLVMFALQELPYMLMPLINPETNPIMNMMESYPALDICEKILGSLCVVLMVFVVHRDAGRFSISDGREKRFFILAVILLLANYAGWALYFTGHQSVFVMMLFIVTLPPLYYMAIGFWRKNTPLTMASGIFLAVHFFHVLLNLLNNVSANVV
ncbi:MAG: hypothetical protein ACSW8G_03395 [Bacillota bacterium]